MKKIISIILTAIMAISALTISAMPVMAKDVMSPTATTVANKKPVLEVNGDSTTDIKYTVDENDPYTITFEYTGDGTLTGWEDNLDDLGLVEGKDYTTTYNEDGSLTIVFISQDAQNCWDNGEVLVNAIVEIEEESTTGNSNGGNKSPNTGVTTSAIAATVAVAGAGFAVLAATKKRDAE